MTKSIPIGHGKMLLQVAREAIYSKLSDQPAPEIELDGFPVELRGNGASFVTLTIDGALRGCVGTIQATDPLVIDVQQRAIAAAFHDPRFPPLTADEYSRIKIEVSCLTSPEKLDYETPDELVKRIRPGIDGEIFNHNFRRAIFLPHVWDQLPEPDLFFGRLCQKMGLDPQLWKEIPIEVEVYQAEKFSEEE